MNDSQDVLEQACATAGIDAEGARLLSVGSNAVFWLKPPVIARVSRKSGSLFSRVVRAISLHRPARAGD
jgi:hypothetical protein